jgi:hypothetical protein
MSGFFKAEPKQAGRYAMSLKLRQWTRNEDHILLAVTLSCCTTGAFVEACEFLCEVLNRQPNVGTKTPSRKWWRERRANLIRNRLWDITVGYRGFTRDPIYAARQRANAKWALVEVEEILMKYCKNTSTTKNVGHLAIILSRTPKEVESALEEIDENDLQSFFYRHGTDRTLCPDFQDTRLTKAIRSFLKLDLDKEDPNITMSQWQHINLLLEDPSSLNLKE